VIAIQKEFDVGFNVFTYILPFVGFIFDHSQKRLYNCKESNLATVIKALLMVFYVGAYVLGLQKTSRSPNFYVIQVNFLIFPIGQAYYSYRLRKSGENGE